MADASPRAPVSECVRLLRTASPDELPEALERLAGDRRSGVMRAMEAAERRLRRHRADLERVASMFETERSLHSRGCTVVAGVDEVGRGALAGPVSAGAAVLPAGARIPGLDDSKRIPPKRRCIMAAEISRVAVAVSVAHVDATRIDTIGIVRATREAMERAIEGLGIYIDHVLVDGTDDAIGSTVTAVVDGDATCASIAAASVVAKVARDDLMRRLAQEHPGYGLDSNKGYSTADHLEAISRLGPSPVHRRSFQPCREDPTLF
jgi:ribonuclease HII